MTADHGGETAAVIVNWVTMTAFAPPPVEANVARAPEEHPDAAILEMTELGDDGYYGG